MSKLTEAYRTLRIFNPHGFAGHGNVFIDYTPEERGRMFRPASWRVYRLGFQTDPNAAWYDHGNKTFLLFSTGTHKERKDAAFEEAKKWASERYGIKEWARTPFGSWMDAEFVKTRMAELSEQLRQL